MGKYLYEDMCYKIIGSSMEVHRRLGKGFLEAVYQEALEKEFRYQSIPYSREVRMRIKYRDEYLEKEYQADFICYNKIIVELKALDGLLTEHEAQVINYLKTSNLTLI